MEIMIYTKVPVVFFCVVKARDFLVAGGRGWVIKALHIL